MFSYVHNETETLPYCNFCYCRVLTFFLLFLSVTQMRYTLEYLQSLSGLQGFTQTALQSWHSLAAKSVESLRSTTSQGGSNTEKAAAYKLLLLLLMPLSAVSNPLPIFHCV